jgi:hypothetical protein
MRHPSEKPLGPRARIVGAEQHAGPIWSPGRASRRHIPTIILSPRGLVLLPPLFPRQLMPMSCTLQALISPNRVRTQTAGCGQLFQQTGTRHPARIVFSRVPSLAKSASVIQLIRSSHLAAARFGTVRLLPTATDEARLVVSFLRIR